MIRRRGFSEGVGILVLGLLAAGAAQAAEGEFMRNAMSGIGLIEPDKPTITYNERAPLAMPPSLSARPGKAARTKLAPKTSATSLEPAAPMTLPLPQPRTSADPQWPKDPEIVRRERDAAEATKPAVHGARGRMNDNNMTLPPDEIAGGHRAGAGLSNAPAGSPGDRADEANWLNPFELLAGRSDHAPSEIEPDRDGLTDPPTGYRKAPTKLGKVQGGPVGGSISGNEEADPRAYMREQTRR